MVKTANIAIIGSAKTPAADTIQRFQNLPERAKIVACGSVDELLANHREGLASANVLLSSTKVGKDAISRLWPHLPKLEWFSVFPAGFGPFLAPELLQSDVVLTNGKGTFSHALAEFALMSCLFFAKKIGRLYDNRLQSKWEGLFLEELRGRTMGIVGYGDIGQACARLARAFGMKVVALRKRTHLTREEFKNDVEVYPPEQLNEMLSKSDYVVNALPGTPATDGFVTREALSHLQPHAVFINVGRGNTVNEEALIAVLKEKRIRGAALDVFDREPLPDTSPFWKLDNVLISSHSASRSTTGMSEAVKDFIENLKRFLAGVELKNVCNKVEGY